MRVLIGTSIHEVKDYAMERWLENVSKLEYPADFLMVDNSPGLNYIEKVKTYCKKYNIKKYKIEHIELPQEQEVFERVARAREIIRREIISKNYDAWFSWECDQIIPTNTLSELVRIIKAVNSDIVELNSWGRGLNIPNCDWGVALINKKPLEKYSFILKFGSDPKMPINWESGEAWFRQQVVRDGGSFIDVYGVVQPIHHLDK